MAKEVLMPKLSSTMDEGYVTEWFKEVGDQVAVGEAIFEVMTDKIAIEVESYDAGVLLGRYVEVGEVVPVNTVIAYIGEAGEVVKQPQAATPSQEEVVSESPQAEAVQEETREEHFEHLDVRATPAARKLVKEHHFDLKHVFDQVKPNTRLCVADVQAFIAAQAVAPKKAAVAHDVSDTIIPWKGIRKSIADQMSKSASTVPHVTLNAQVNADQLINLRQSLLDEVQAEAGARLTYTHLLAYFVSRVLSKHPLLNAHVLDDGIHLKKQVNLGIATAIPTGLIVPVVEAANTQSIGDLAAAISDLSNRAKDNSLSPDDLKGGTFTITSLGSTAVVDFNPIINIPEAAILGVGTMVDTLGLDPQGQVTKHKVMTLSLSFDHRAVDGYPAALFLTDLVQLIENPNKLMKY